MAGISLGGVFFHGGSWALTHDDTSLELWSRMSVASKGPVARLTVGDLLGEEAERDPDEVGIVAATAMRIGTKHLVAVVAQSSGETKLFLYDPLENEIVAVPMSFMADSITALCSIPTSANVGYASDILVLGSDKGQFDALVFNEAMRFQRKQTFKGPASTVVQVTAMTHFADGAHQGLAVGYSDSSLRCFDVDAAQAHFAPLELLGEQQAFPPSPVTTIRWSGDYIIVAYGSLRNLRRYRTSLKAFQVDHTSRSVRQAAVFNTLDGGSPAIVSALALLPGASCIAVAVDDFSSPPVTRLRLLHFDGSGEEIAALETHVLDLAVAPSNQLLYALTPVRIVPIKLSAEPKPLPMVNPAPTGTPLAKSLFLKWRAVFQGPIASAYAAHKEFVGDELFIDKLMATLGVDGALYPPTSPAHLQELLGKLESIEVDSLKVQCLIYYFLLDLGAGLFSPSYEQPSVDRRFADFYSRKMSIPQNYHLLMDAYWLLDHPQSDVNLKSAVELLCDPQVHANWPDLVLRRLLKFQQFDEALRLIVCERALPDDDTDIHLLVYLSKGLIHDAFVFQRQHRQLGETTLFTSMLDYVFQTGELRTLETFLSLPLDQAEDDALMDYLQRTERSAKLTAFAITYLLSRGRYIEAIRFHEAAGESNLVRDALIGNIKQALPAVQLQLLNLGAAPRPKVDLPSAPRATIPAPLHEPPKPVPLSSLLRTMGEVENHQKALLQMMQQQPLPSDNLADTKEPQPTYEVDDDAMLASSQFTAPKTPVSSKKKAPAAKKAEKEGGSESPVFLRPPSAIRSTLDTLRRLNSYGTTTKASSEAAPRPSPQASTLRPSVAAAVSSPVKLAATLSHSPFKAPAATLSHSPFKAPAEPAVSPVPQQQQQQQPLLPNDTAPRTAAKHSITELYRSPTITSTASHRTQLASPPTSFRSSVAVHTPSRLKGKRHAPTSEDDGDDEEEEEADAMEQNQPPVESVFDESFSDMHNTSFTGNLLSGRSEPFSPMQPLRLDEVTFTNIGTAAAAAAAEAAGLSERDEQRAAAVQPSFDPFSPPRTRSPVYASKEALSAASTDFTDYGGPVFNDNDDDDDEDGFVLQTPARKTRSATTTAPTPSRSTRASSRTRKSSISESETDMATPRRSLRSASKKGTSTGSEAESVATSADEDDPDAAGGVDLLSPGHVHAARPSRKVRVHPTSTATSRRPGAAGIPPLLPASSSADGGVVTRSRRKTQNH